MSEHSVVPVSVVIPCFKCAKTIGRAVASVAEQTSLPAEVILVEDGSADETLTVLQRIAAQYQPGWIRVVALPENLGAASARNIGWSTATQEYVALLDSDDSWHPCKIQHQYQFMRRHPDVDLSGHFYEIDVDNRIEKQVHPATPRSFRYIGRYEMLIKNRLVTPSVMFKRSLAFRFLEGRRHVEDHLLWMQMAFSGSKIVLIGATMAFVHKAMYGQSGLSSNMWEMEQSELENYYLIYKSGYIGGILLMLLTVYSICKYLKRIVVLCYRKCFNAATGSL